MKINLKRGFTLLELLVVVAIIGILTAVVLTSTVKSRNKGMDAGVKANLRNAIAQAEVFYITNTVANNTYASICNNGQVGDAYAIGSYVSAAAKAVGLSSAVNSTLGTAGTYNTATCHVDATGTAWAAEVPLSSSVSGTPVMWCVDSVGKSKQESDNLAPNDLTCT